MHDRLRTRQQSAELKIKKLNSLLVNTLKYQKEEQKRYANQLLTEIMLEFSAIDNQIDTLEAKRYTMSNKKFDSVFDTFLHLIQSMGFIKRDIETLKADVIQFIFSNLSYFKRHPNCQDVMTIHKWYDFFKDWEGRPPKDIEELKTKINEYTKN